MPTEGRPTGSPPSRLVLLGQFVLIPLVVVVIGISVFILFGLVGSERRTSADYLREIRTGHANRRWQAAFELARELRQTGGATDPDLVPRVLDTFEWAREEDPQIRRYLAQALGILGDRRAIPALVEALADPDADTRLWATTALSAVGEPRDWETLRPVLADSDPAVRKQAAHSLGALGAREARDDLVPLLQDPVADVSWNAALSLAWLDDHRGLPVLLSMLDRERLSGIPGLRPDQEELAMVSALQALARLRSPSARETVHRLAENDESLRVRQAALLALDELVGNAGPDD